MIRTVIIQNRGQSVPLYLQSKSGRLKQPAVISLDLR
uniref:Uncharacterized protein n=1 Tax=Anguilla anguilla TaxID=7936 RepID=A0A0E9QI77_ANGAN